MILLVRSVLASFVLPVAALAAGADALGSAEADGKGAVVQVLAGRDADLVVVSGGHDRGFRPGAVCTVSRDGRPFGSVVIAESARDRSVGLILSLDPLEASTPSRIRAGDTLALRANPRI